MKCDKGLLTSLCTSWHISNTSHLTEQKTATKFPHLTKPRASITAVRDGLEKGLGARRFHINLTVMRRLTASNKNLIQKYYAINRALAKSPKILEMITSGYGKLNAGLRLNCAKVWLTFENILNSVISNSPLFRTHRSFPTLKINPVISNLSKTEHERKLPSDRQRVRSVKQSRLSHTLQFVCR